MLGRHNKFVKGKQNEYVNAYWKIVGVRELRKDNKYIKNKEGVDLGKDCWGWEARVQKRGGRRETGGR